MEVKRELPFRIVVQPQRLEKKFYGRVVAYRDGIATVEGLGNIGYYENVQFEEGAKGIVMDVDPQLSYVVTTSGEVHIGEMCLATGEVPGIPVGYDVLGKVLDPLGNVLEGDTFTPAQVYPVERPAKPLYERSRVNEPVETGIAAIDMLIPVGHGQRELILGDRQVGKTTLATDILINQKGKDVIGVYVSIGQKVSDTAAIINSFKVNDVMDQVVMVVAAASDPAIVRFLAPYAGASIAEYFMEQGRKVIIVFDDLSKHAVSYRELTLLLRRPPGREAYPGDIFYAHSRLLERAAKLTNGGSITAFPICETQLGDFSAYIPTNLISITDGQLFLGSGLFNAGRRPAINIGLSVSRVGGAAQYPAIRKLSSGLRSTLARYEELSEFTRFGGKLDDASQKILSRGERTIKLLVQAAHELYSSLEQAALLVLLNNGYFDAADVGNVKEVWNSVREYLRTEVPQLKSVDLHEPLDDETTRLILMAGERAMKIGKLNGA